MMIADHMQAKLRGDLQWIDEDNLVVGKTGRKYCSFSKRDGSTTKCTYWYYWLRTLSPFYFDGAMPFNTLNGIKEAFPYAKFSSVYRDFFRRASVKSEEELAHVRYAAAIGEAMS